MSEEQTMTVEEMQAIAIEFLESLKGKNYSISEATSIVNFVQQLFLSQINSLKF